MGSQLLGMAGRRERENRPDSQKCPDDRRGQALREIRPPSLRTRRRGEGGNASGGLGPYDMDRRLGLLTRVSAGIFRPRPQNGSSTGWIHSNGCQVATKNCKFGEPVVVGGTSFRAGGKKRSCHAFTLTIRQCKQEKKGLIKDYFENPSSPEHEDEVRRLQTLPQGGAGRPDKKP